MEFSGQAEQEQRPGARGASHALGRAEWGTGWRITHVVEAAGATSGADQARRLLAGWIAARLAAQLDGAPAANAPATAPATPSLLQGGK